MTIPDSLLTFTRRLACFASVTLLLAGCNTTSIDHPNLHKIIEPEMAEVTGSRMPSIGGTPREVYPTHADGAMLPSYTFDRFSNIWKLEPGMHTLALRYSHKEKNGLSTQNIVGQGSIAHKMEAGHRYIVRFRFTAENKIVFYLEDYESGQMVAESQEVEVGPPKSFQLPFPI